MPELPEVETVRRGLAPVMQARRFVQVEARRPDLRFALPDRFSERLTGSLVIRLDRRGKHLIALLGSGESLVMHLGMSGRFTIETGVNDLTPGSFAHARDVNRAHDHVVFVMEGGARVTFNDPRRFGYMRLYAPGALEREPPFASMGPEPLSDAFTATALRAACAGRRSPIKAALLDQNTVAGLGNIYVCEALYRARISPRRLAANVGRPGLARLVPAIKDVLEEAIASGGSSLRDYAHTDGSLGYFQHAFAVYGREGEACRREGCGAPVARIVQSGRSTFFCGRCQR